MCLNRCRASPRRGDMFIARAPENLRRGSEGRNSTCQVPISSRSAPPNRAGGICQGWIYKHFTPPEWKPLVNNKNRFPKLSLNRCGASPRRGWHVYSSWAREPPARFGGAELKVPSTNLVSFRPSEPRGWYLPGLDL